MQKERIASPELLLSLVSRHVEALQYLQTDMGVMLSSGQVYAALPFSFLHPSLTPRPLTITRANDHYDLMCSTIYRKLPALSNTVYYKLFVPFSTIGKMFNHLAHQADILRSISAETTFEGTASAIMKHFPHHRASANDIALMISDFVEQASSAQFTSRTQSLVNLFSTNSIKGPYDIGSIKRRMTSTHEAEMFDSLRRIAVAKAMIVTFLLTDTSWRRLSIALV